MHVKIIGKFRSLGRKAMAMQEKMFIGIYISSSWTQDLAYD